VSEGREHLLGQPNHRALPLLRALAGKSELDFQQRRTNPWWMYRNYHPSGVIKALDFPRAAEIVKERVDVVDCRLYFNSHFVPVLRAELSRRERPDYAARCCAYSVREPLAYQGTLLSGQIALRTVRMSEYPLTPLLYFLRNCGFGNST